MRPHVLLSAVFSNVAPVVAAGTKIYEAVVVNEYRSTKQGNKFYVHEVCGSDGSLLVLDDAGRIKQKQESADTVLKTEEGGERPSFPANKIITQNDAPVKKTIRSEKVRTLQRKSPYPHRLDGIGLNDRTSKSNPMKFYFLHGSLQQNSSSVFPCRLHGKPHCITARHWIHDSNSQMFWAAE